MVGTVAIVLVDAPAGTLLFVVTTSGIELNIQVALLLSSFGDTYEPGLKPLHFLARCICQRYRNTSPGRRTSTLCLMLHNPTSSNVDRIYLQWKGRMQSTGSDRFETTYSCRYRSGRPCTWDSWIRLHCMVAGCARSNQSIDR